MNGEIVMNIESVHSDHQFMEPNDSMSSSNDLTIVAKDGECLHICGKNDWGYLAIELLKPILKAGTELYTKVSNEISEYNPEVVLVGTNDYRLLDIIHIARDSEFGISVIKGVPIIKGDFVKGIKHLGKKDTNTYLPY